ncbi:MAG: CARF domain containing protein [Candidatus Methanohalarchaeum thermophilum]|uniref:CARF domain containing protein n=1 Tax=Methanohalarchaeum thermophilum TaxID=1903181 RepID=A0A1Q6DWJ4_METT1|nr:MAG: CARF domain containing protein [Candidatus Methanohalarchaeum thermophilum]
MPQKQAGTHIIAGGLEYDRLFEPMFGDYPIDNLVILRGVSDYKEPQKLADHFTKKLEKNVKKEVVIEEIDIYDFEEVFKKTLESIEEHSATEKPVYLNISSAPKLALVAMISAAFLSNNSDVEIFYASPKEYLLPKMLVKLDEAHKKEEKTVIKELNELMTKFKDSGFGKGINSLEQIPMFPVEKIKDIDKKILKVLNERKEIKSISKLIKNLEETEEEVKRTSIQYRLNKLKEKNLIRTKRENRETKIKIERLGELYIKRFEWR